MAADEGGGDGGGAPAAEIQEEAQAGGEQEFADDGAVAAAAEGPNPDPLPSENFKEDLTLTDHLNKSLLESFLKRINMPGSEVPVMPPMETEDLPDEAEQRENGDQ